MGQDGRGKGAWGANWMSVSLNGGARLAGPDPIVTLSPQRALIRLARAEPLVQAGSRPRSRWIPNPESIVCNESDVPQMAVSL